MKKNKQIIVCRACLSPLNASGSIVKCKECGAVHLLPAELDESTAELFKDGFSLLNRDDFYSAIRLFEAIVKTQPSAAAYFGLFMAKYGFGSYRERITGEMKFTCKRRNTASPRTDEALMSAISLANEKERAVIEECVELIIREQSRLAKEEEAKSELLAGDEGLAPEIIRAQKLAEEKKQREMEERELQAEKEKALENARLQARVREAKLAKRKKLIKTAAIITAPIIALALGAIVVINSIIIPSTRYKQAVAAYNAQNYADAAVLFRELGSYKDSKQFLSEIKLFGLETGDTVTLGSYYQSNANTPEPLAWTVLESGEDYVLLITEKVVEVKKYNNTLTSVTWATSDLRKFLNVEFYSRAFSDAERALILSTHLVTDDNVSQGTIGGEDTDDLVFILSAEETERLLAGKSYAVGYCTEYVRARGVYENPTEKDGSCMYWLRSAGSSQSNAVKVDYDGSINLKGANVDYSKYGVRPVIRIKITKTP